ncbi:MAG TPA: hypothetical protein VF572_06435 [Candidatus Saccharimonadales bacterium]|jgi:hypothetical protein
MEKLLDCLVVLYGDQPRTQTAEAVPTLVRLNPEDHMIGDNDVLLRLDVGNEGVCLRDTGGNKPIALSTLSLLGNPNTKIERILADLRPIYVITRNAHTVRVYSVVLSYEYSMLFIHSGNIQFTEGTDIHEVIEECTRLHMKNQIALSNQDAYFKKYHPDNEIEYKLNLPNSTNIWALSKSFYQSIANGELENIIVQPLDPFNEWEFHNYLFETVAPESKRGYVSFITCPDEEYVVKEKVYAHDMLERIERRTKNVRLKGSMEEYLAEHYRERGFKRHEPFSRRRYDVNIESIATGNVYSIMIDNCWLINDDGYKLTQCEIEYLKTRSVQDFQGVNEELTAIYEYVKKELNKKGITYVETFYSKLSFVRDYAG